MNDRLTHAGGVVRRADGKILLVRAKPEPHDWVLPKGHIEKGERPEDTAVREVAEEAGVAAGILRPLGVIEFTKPNGSPARVLFFLMQFAREVAPAETRDVRWWTIDEALSMIPYENTCAIIEAAR